MLIYNLVYKIKTATKSPCSNKMSEKLNIKNDKCVKYKRLYYGEFSITGSNNIFS